MYVSGAIRKHLHGYPPPGALAQAAPWRHMCALGGVRAHHHEQHSECVPGLLQQCRDQREELRECAFWFLLLFQYHQFIMFEERKARIPLAL